MDFGEESLGWVAALIEGEGCITSDRYGCPRVRVKMCDRDVVERFARAVGIHRINVQEPREAKHRASYQASIAGTRCVPLLEAVLPLMGERRAARIRSVLAAVDVRKAKRGEPKTYLLSDK